MIKKLNTRDSIICQNNDSIFNYLAWPSVTWLPGYPATVERKDGSL